MKFKNEESVHSFLFFYQTKCNVVFFNVMVEKCYCWTQHTKQHNMFYVSLPICFFFLVVKTNADYQIVETFITENEIKTGYKRSVD